MPYQAPHADQRVMGIFTMSAAEQRPILTIDTSSAQGGIAWYDGAHLSLRSWPAERSHTTTLLAEIHHLLDADGIGTRDIAAIAVAIGPGAFTGLRAGIGAAKGFHLATGVPLIGVSTLAATALPFVACGQPIVATVAAGRGRLVWAHYRADGAGVMETRPPRNGTIGELAEELATAEGVIISGELDAQQVEAITGIDGVIVPPAALRSRQPSSLAEIGWRRWLAGQVDDATALEPVYLSR
jgi:tRNA threonylcarbamoyladenosine biosynthesis protein TsaB